MDIADKISFEYANLLRSYVRLGKETPKFEVVCEPETLMQIRSEKAAHEMLLHTPSGISEHIIGLPIRVDNAQAGWALKEIKDT